MMEKLAQPGDGVGVHAHHLSVYLPSRTKFWCTLQLRGQIHYPPISSLPLYVLCVGEKAVWIGEGRVQNLGLEFLNKAIGARNLVGIGLSYRPAKLNRLAESIPWNRFLGSLKVWKYSPPSHTEILPMSDPTLYLILGYRVIPYPTQHPLL